MRVLLTGAAGYIGGLIIAELADRYDWVLTDLHSPAETHGLPFFPADITDLAALRPLCKEAEIIVHLAALAKPEAALQDLLQPNIVGVYNLFQAASEAGCRRVIFASSAQTVEGYPRDLQIRAEMPISPITLYGATKVWGEALAAYYAHQKNLSAICLRLGWVMSRNDRRLMPGARHLDIILTPEDLIRLITASLDAPDDLRFGIFHGVSNNRWKRLDISDTRAQLKYAPQDDAFTIARRNYPTIVHQWIQRIKRVLKSALGWK
jgi:nucleoside-diphosphate-sugar epimerase